MIALLLPAVQKVRSAALHLESANNLKQVGIAMHGYANAYRGFPRIFGVNPATGEFEFSFLVALLPFLEQQNVYRAFKEQFPGSGISDAFLVPIYRSPLDPTGPSTDASYAANASVFTRRMNFNTITDGTSSTVGMAEHYSYDCGGIRFSWTSPLKSPSNIPGIPGARRATFADKRMGDVYPVSQGGTTVPSVAGLSFQVAPAIANCDPRLAQAASPGGLLAGMIDGSVRTLAPSISLATYWSLLTPQGGEVLGPDW